jgi:capsular exopolysaccharide synthesis family protein
MDLTHLVQTLRRYWFIAALAFVVVFGIGLAAAFVPQKQYETSATVLVAPNPNGDPNAAYQVVQVGLPQAAAKAASRSFADSVYKDLPAALRDSGTSVSTSTDPTSGVLTLDATGPNPAATAPIANAFAKKLVTDQSDTSQTQLTVLDRALTPGAPSSPKKGPILVGAFVLGLIVAVLSTLLVAALTRIRKQTDAFRHQISSNVLAEIPTAPTMVRGSELWATLDPRKAPVLSESLQQLRANVEFASRDARDGLVLAITSTREGEGKSTIAANLAWLLAAIGHDVLLIDADLRRPTLHRLLDLPQGPGLAAAPAGEVTRLVDGTRQPRLDFLPAGVPDRHPAEIVSAGLPAVIREFRSPNRIILIDTPPLGSAAETAVVCSIAGAAVLVVDGHRRDPDEVEEAEIEIESRGAEVLGIVLNRVRTRHLTNRPDRGYFVNAHGLGNGNGAANGNGNGNGAPRNGNGSARRSSRSETGPGHEA